MKNRILLSVTAILLVSVGASVSATTVEKDVGASAVLSESLSAYVVPAVLPEIAAVDGGATTYVTILMANEEFVVLEACRFERVAVDVSYTDSEHRFRQKRMYFNNKKLPVPSFDYIASGGVSNSLRA